MIWPSEARSYPHSRVPSQGEGCIWRGSSESVTQIQTSALFLAGITGCEFE